AGRVVVRALADSDETRDEGAARVRAESTSRWMIIVPPNRIDAARAAYDPSRTFATVTLPAIRDVDRVALWVCASFEDPDANLARVLGVFFDAARGHELPATPWQPWRHDGSRIEGWFLTPV